MFAAQSAVYLLALAAFAAPCQSFRVRAGAKTTECPDRQEKPSCATINEWIREQREDGMCRPNSPWKVHCNAGSEPTSNRAWLQFRSGQCDDYYMAKSCAVQNSASLSTPSDCSALSVGVEDCQRLDEATVAAAASHDAADELSLAEEMDQIMKRGENDWWYLPSHRFAIYTLAQALEGRLQEESKPGAGGKFEKIWSVLLDYCDGADGRAAEMNNGVYNDADRQDGAYECSAITNLFELAPLHPLLPLVKEGASLSALVEEGLLTMNEQRWKQLRFTAGGELPDFQTLSHMVHELMKTAGNHSEIELDLALQMSQFGIGKDAKPEGGARRLAEMSTLRTLRNAVSRGDNQRVLDEAIAAATKLVNEDGQMKWIDAVEFNRMLFKAKDLAASSS